MAMVGSEMATSVADAMKADGQFDIRDSNGDFNFDQTSYDLTVSNLTVQYGAQIKYIQDNMEVTTELDVGFNSVISSGVPAPNDGGATLQTGQKAFISANAITVDKAQSTEVK